MKLHHKLAALAAGLVLSVSSQAAVVLYFADYHIGANAMGAALTAGGHTTTTATSESDFASKVALGGWDLVVYFRQNYSSAATADAALSGWVTGGNKAIFADWARNASMGSLFGASYTGTNNQTSVTVTDALLDDGLTNPLSLSNPGWGTFAVGLDATTGVSAALFGNGTDAIVIGNSGRTILNGFLGDTLGANGQTMFTNQLNLLLDERAEVPEPASVALVGLALGAVGLSRRRKQPA